MEIKRLKESESILKREMELLQTKITDMEHELLARKEVVEAANEAIVIKVCLHVFFYMHISVGLLLDKFRTVNRYCVGLVSS